MRSREHLDELIIRYPALEETKNEILAATEKMRNSFASGHKLLIAGNGGSAADAEHIVGELMKSFLIRDRKVGQMPEVQNKSFGSLMYV